MVASATKKMSQPAPKSHPAWTDMIAECITTTPDGPRYGVSRPAIKKFVDSKYHLPMNAAATSQLNRAITRGTVSGDFTLPKGPSGKVKLAPKRVAENTNSPAKPPRARKAMGTGKKPPVSTSKTKVASFAEEQQPKPMPATRKYTSMAKKARVTGKAATKRGGVSRTLTGIAAKTRSATKKGFCFTGDYARFVAAWQIRLK